MSFQTMTRNGWTVWHVVMAILLPTAGVLATRAAWADIYHLAIRDAEFRYIVLVPVIAVWLVWVRRGRLRRCSPVGGMLGVPIVAAGWVIGSTGYYLAIESFWHAGAVLVLIGCLVTVLGRHVFLRFLPAFGLLLFLVPVPGMIRQEVALPLQAMVAGVTEWFFVVVGAPVSRMGNVLTINGRHVAIAEACSGLRMVFALVMVSYCFAFSLPVRGYVRALIVLASPLSAVVCNVIRTIPTVWVYGYMPRFADIFHDVTGWIMLIVAFLLLVGIIRLLKWASVPVSRFTLAYE